MIRLTEYDYTTDATERCGGCTGASEDTEVGHIQYSDCGRHSVSVVTEAHVTDSGVADQIDSYHHDRTHLLALNPHPFPHLHQRGPEGGSVGMSASKTVVPAASGDDGGISAFRRTYGESVTFHGSTHVSRLSVAPYTCNVLKKRLNRAHAHLWAWVVA
jgi:hypothetical protein